MFKIKLSRFYVWPLRRHNQRWNGHSEASYSTLWSTDTESSNNSVFIILALHDYYPVSKAAYSCYSQTQIPNDALLTTPNTPHTDGFCTKAVFVAGPCYLGRGTDLGWPSSVTSLSRTACVNWEHNSLSCINIESFWDSTDGK